MPNPNPHYNRNKEENEMERFTERLVLGLSEATCAEYSAMEDGRPVTLLVIWTDETGCENVDVACGFETIDGALRVLKEEGNESPIEILK